ncbi:MAG: hypothetical protein ABIJ20_03950 [Nanoarchaeota archaeon]|nr:hypothetical protein [Nanoarchaeota archaeon]MBU1445472.1 hypothetical protein [Nanoarchaeota archaeon]MBU2420654.1 hypothetical protein [Nanoarchaeota archaeon]MBU2475391.1 hypothetical protein [Nanoarchaeota archaeon]
MANAYDFIYSFQDAGIFDIVLPFLLIFAIIFAVLEKGKIFGDKKSNINLVIALVIGLLVVIKTDIVSKINTYLPKMALVYVIAIGLLIFFGLMSGEKNKVALPTYFAVILGAAGVIWALASGTGLSWPDWMQLTETARNLIIGIGIAIIVIVFVYGGRGKDGSTAPGKSKGKAFEDWLKESFTEK